MLKLVRTKALSIEPTGRLRDSAMSEVRELSTQDEVWTIKGLGSDGPYPEFKDELMLFGQFVGDWELEARYPKADGTEIRGNGEIHFGWILNGTAIQDTMTGVVENPPPGFSKTGFGTMVRFYDPKIDAWHCVWIGPSVHGGGVVETFKARKIADEIVLEGTNSKGFVERWIFSDITHDSFNWRAVATT